VKTFFVPWQGVLALFFVVHLSGCEGARYERARAKDTPQGYLRYLHDEPHGAHRASAARLLEAARFRQAQAAKRPYGYRRYLQTYPRGRYAPQAREGLARLALKVATTPHAWEEVLDRYPQTPQAKQAEVRLAAFLADLALSSHTPSDAEVFLARFPHHARVGVVRGHLAALRFTALGAGVEALEQFLANFPGTPPVAVVRRRLRRLLVDEVRRNPSPARFHGFIARFPRDPERSTLEELVTARARRVALVRLDPVALQHLMGSSLRPAGAEKATLLRVAGWCKRRTRACAELRGIARAALAFRPLRSLSALRRDAANPELMLAWEAIARLAWIDEPAAGDALLDLHGADHLPTVWAAQAALKRWLQRSGSTVSLRWKRRQLAGHVPRANPDEIQRRAVVELISGREVRGRQRLESLPRGSARALVGRYLALVYVPQWRGSTALFGAAQKRLHAIEGVFPERVDSKNIMGAVLAERELFVLHRVLEAALSRAGRDEHPLSRRAGQLLARWRRRISLFDATFRVASPPQVGVAAGRHAEGRPRALRGLSRRRDLAGRAVFSAVCGMLAASEALAAVKNKTVVSPCKRHLRAKSL